MAGSGEPIGLWVERYLGAWRSNEPADIRALFTTDAEYFPEPWAEPWRGREEIVRNWLERRDEPGRWTFEWSPVVSTDDISIVRGVTRYAAGITYSNLWLIRLAPDGRARAFTEWWMDQANPS